MIAAVVLAAGSGSRFGPGPPKVLAEVGGKSLLDHVMAALRAATPVGQIVVVLGYAADQVEAGADLSQATVVRNPDHASGMASSVRVGVKAVVGEVEAALMVMGDQPGISTQVVDALFSAYRTHLKPIAVPTYAGQRGTPVLLARPIFPQVMALEGDTGARALMEERPRWVMEVPADGLADPRDIDTPADLRAMQGGGSPS